jgi:hypothetical protein
MKWPCIQPQKEDAIQGVDKDTSINSHAMVEKPSGYSKNTLGNLLSNAGVHGYIYYEHPS